MPGRGENEPTGFGRRLREAREQKGLTQKQLADTAGTHVNTVARLEREEQEPAWPLVLKLAKALGVDCTAFAGAESNSPVPEPPTEKSAKDTLKKPKGKRKK
jgi:transcriptional regulator with XRE-family HTH domain